MAADGNTTVCTPAATGTFLHPAIDVIDRLRLLGLAETTAPHLPCRDSESMTAPKPLLRTMSPLRTMPFD